MAAQGCGSAPAHFRNAAQHFRSPAQRRIFPRPSGHTSVAGLTLGQTYWFRVRGNAGGQTGSWTDAVALVVH